MEHYEDDIAEQLRAICRSGSVGQDRDWGTYRKILRYVLGFIGWVALRIGNKLVRGIGDERLLGRPIYE